MNRKLQSAFIPEALPMPGMQMRNKTQASWLFQALPGFC